jgi:hypothetical protein
MITLAEENCNHRIIIFSIISQNGMSCNKKGGPVKKRNNISAVIRMNKAQAAFCRLRCLKRYQYFFFSTQ